MSKPEFLAVVGPTGTGKSALALEIVHFLNSLGIRSEIINADSMQFYRGMDIGTAKLSPEQREGITHHLLDWLAITEESTAANYQKLARAKIEDLQGSGVFPVVVGGSMLYIASLLNPFEFPGRDPQLRAQLEQELIDLGPEALHQRLAKLDATAASRIDPKNGRRVVRALEIVLHTGEPFAAALPEQWVSYKPNLQVGLNSDRAHLVSRLAIRVRKMWDEGIVDEVEGLLAEGLRQSKTAKAAIGYAQSLNQIDGLLSQEEAIEQTTLLTNRYSRRQMSWFRRDPRIQWFDYQRVDLTNQVFELIKTELEL